MSDDWHGWQGPVLVVCVVGDVLLIVGLIFAPLIVAAVKKWRER